MPPDDPAPAPPVPAAAGVRAPDPVAVRVWDLPTRVFHWTLALAVVGLVVTAKTGGNAMVWHFRLGYVVLALLLFRLAWGLVGGHWSRFASFIHPPATVVRYLRGAARADEHLEIGHNPLGAFSVLAMLVVLAVQVATGLVADDEIANQGPLNALVSGDTALAATSWHQHWGQWLLLALVALHVLAIAVYRLGLRKDLVRPMLVGDKLLPAPAPASADGARQRLLALALIAAAALAVALLLRLAP